MDVIKVLKAYVKCINKKWNENYQKLSLYDLAQQDILHFIETDKYRDSMNDKLMEKLLKIRHERRKVKNELEAIQSIRDRLQGAGLHRYKRPVKTYTYQTKIMESVLEDCIE